VIPTAPGKPLQFKRPRTDPGPANPIPVSVRRKPGAALSDFPYRKVGLVVVERTTSPSVRVTPRHTLQRHLPLHSIDHCPRRGSDCRKWLHRSAG
jgi:hypothetical protein